MGGWMTYQRVRSRNNLMYRKPDDDPDPYWRTDAPNDFAASILVGDLNRMERDYLSPQYPQRPFALREDGSDPLSRTSAATGVDIEDVRRVLRHVFLEQT